MRYTRVQYQTAWLLAGGSAHEVPAGYVYKGMVEFTESPHHQRPHAFLDDGSFDTAQHASKEGEVLETLLVTPDGRMYSKPCVLPPSLQPCHRCLEIAPC